MNVPVSYSIGDINFSAPQFEREKHMFVSNIKIYSWFFVVWGLVTFVLGVAEPSLLLILSGGFCAAMNIRNLVYIK